MLGVRDEVIVSAIAVDIRVVREHAAVTGVPFVRRGGVVHALGASLTV